MRVLLLWIFAAWKPAGRFTLAAFRRLFGFGGYMLSARLLDTLSNRAQLLLLGWLFNASTLGFYTLAQNAQQAPTDLMGAVLSRVGLPVFSEISGQPEKLRKALQFTLRVSLFLFLPCMIGLSLLAKPAIQVVYGERWISAAPIMALLALASALWPVHVLNLATLTSQGRADRFLRLEIVKKVVTLALVIAASPWGPVAVAWAVLASSLVSAFINTHYSKHMLGYGLRAQILDQRLTLLLCALAAAAGWTILHWTQASLWHTLSAIAAAAAIYIGGAYLFRNKALDDLSEVGRALLESRHARGMGPSS
jgi:teichuronic acid exporter